MDINGQSTDVYLCRQHVQTCVKAVKRAVEKNVNPMERAKLRNQENARAICFMAQNAKQRLDLQRAEPQPRNPRRRRRTKSSQSRDFEHAHVATKYFLTLFNTRTLQ
jgi:hypothetical protein